MRGFAAPHIKSPRRVQVAGGYVFGRRACGAAILAADQLKDRNHQVDQLQGQDGKVEIDHVPLLL